MERLQLIITHFDTFENRSSEHSEHLVTFISDNERSAHDKLSDYLRTLSPKLYSGYDGKIYPRYFYKTIAIT